MNQPSDNKRIAKNTVALFIRMLMVAVIGLISSRLMLQNLGEIDFGIYNVVGGIAQMMTFFNIVLSSATIRFMVVELGKKDEGDISKVFSASIILHALMGLTIIILGETIGLYYIYNYLNVPIEKFNAAFWIFQVSIFVSSMCVFQIPFQAILISYENFTRFAIVQIGIALSMLIVSYLIGLYHGDRLLPFGIMMGGAQLMGLFLYAIMARKYVPKIKKISDTGIIKNMFSFSTWISVGAAAIYGKNQGCNMILNYFFGPIVNTAFSIANQINNQMSQFGQTVGRAFNPQIMKSYVQCEKERMISLIVSSDKYTFFLLYLIVVPIFVKNEYIFDLWLGNYPEETIFFCRIIMVSVLVESLKQSISPALQANGNIKWYQVIYSLISLLALPVSALAFIFGANSYAVSVIYLISSCLNLLLSLYFYKTILKVPVKIIFRNNYLRCLYVGIISVPLYILLQYLPNHLGGLLLTLFISTIYLMLAIYVVGIENEERRIVHSFVKRYIKNLF